MNDLETSLGDISVEKCYRIAKNSELGRHILVTKDVKKGDIIFKDIPLVTGPSRESAPCCVSCYKLLDLNTEASNDAPSDSMDVEDDDEPVPYVKCPKCSWPLCSLECAQKPIHAAECFFLSKSGVEFGADDTDSLYDVVTVLRCLHLMTTNKKAWEALISLQEANPEKLDKELANRAKMVTALICGTFGLGDLFPMPLVFDICTRLDINSFEIPVARTSATVQGVYSVACMVEHSCIPTGHRCFNSDMSITVRSAYGAEEGDNVSICYTDSLWATAARRENLVYSKDFLCTCDRCQDETENETYMSAIKCTKCPGFFLPTDPMNCESKWVCNECGNEAPAGYHEMANAKVAQAIVKLEESGLTPEKCDKFLATYTKVLHPHHAHILDVKFSLLNLLGHTQGAAMSQLSEAQLTTKEGLARTFLGIASKILPGISRLKGSALFELYLVMQQRGIRAMNSLELSPEESLMILKNAFCVLADCIECLQYEPGHTAEGGMCARAREEQGQMVQLMKSIEEKIEK